MADRLQFGILAGERSGDILGAGLIKALRQHYPNAKFTGIGGPDMELLGCRSLAPMERLSVMGFVEPLGRLPELLGIKRKLEQHFKAHPPAAFIGIDSPDFNLRVEEVLKGAGIPTIHYVSPSVWAYRKNRIRKIKRAVDLMLTLFPFETAIYEGHGVPVSCVGHPLADQIGFDDNKAQARTDLGFAAEDALVALLPGSRSSEINRLAQPFLGAAVAALQSQSGLRFVIPYSGAESKACIEQALRQSNIFIGEQFQLIQNSQLAMTAADFIVMASGTATLEAMLLRKPMLVCYRLAPITYAIASRIVNVPHMALPNLLAGQRLVPELVQDEVTVTAIRDEILRYFSDPADFEARLGEFEPLHRELRKDASTTAAAAIKGLLNLPN